MLDAHIYANDGTGELGEYYVEYYDADLQEWVNESTYSLQEFTQALQYAEDLADDLAWTTRLILSKHVETVWRTFTPRC